MAANDVVCARIDPHIKEQATAVLDAIGLTVSDVLRIFPTRVAYEKKLPFKPLMPNETTIKAMRQARKSGLKSFASVAALMTDLDEDDWLVRHKAD